MTSVGIVIVCWNGLEHTLRSLESVVPQALVRGATVTVVDNGSTDDTAKTIRSLYPSINLVVLEQNTGFTGGVRAGIEATETTHIVLLNNDAVPRESWLDALCSALESASEDVVAISGKIVDFAGQRIDFIGGAMTFDGHAFQNDFGRRVGTVEEPPDGTELLFACGGNMIVRRREFLAIGGFDDAYFAYLEDVDFGWRSWIAGYRILYASQAVVKHRSSATSDTLGSFERGVLFERNALRTSMKNFEDSLFREVSGVIFLTLLHRLHRYVIDRNGDTSALSTPAIGAASKGAGKGLLSRIKAVVRPKRAHAAITDDLTRMQFRAMSAIFESMEEIAAERSRIQKMRKRSDAEIFAKFPLLFVPTYHGDEVLFSSTLFKSLKPAINSEQSSLEELMRR